MNALGTTLNSAFMTFAERPALVVGSDVLNYAELAGAAWAFADQLKRSTPEGSRIGVLAQRTIAAYVAVLGSIWSGRAYVPINPKFPFDKQKAIAGAADCSAYVFDDKSEEMAEALAAQTGGCLLKPDHNAREHASEVTDGRHAYVMFTSGTTGAPKGVAVRYDNVKSYLEAFAEIAEIHPSDRCTQFFDLSFDLSVHDMMVTWTSGACLCVPTDDELIDPVGFAVRQRTTCWFSVPSVVAMAKRMRRLAPDVLPDLRLALFCGEALSKSLVANWIEAAPEARIFNLYGPTETTIAITAYMVDPRQLGQLPSTVPLGTAYAKCEVAVVTDSDTPVDADGQGELLLAGAQLTDGYVNNPQEHQKKFVHRSIDNHRSMEWYRSGDLVRVDPEWGLLYVGRIDDQIKISGYRVELLEVEEAVRKAAADADVAVVGWPRNAEGAINGLVAFVTGHDINEGEMIDRCRSLLPAYMVPKRVVVVDSLPLNANGKIDRNALRITFLEGGR